MRFNAKVASLLLGLVIGASAGGMANKMWPDAFGPAVDANERILVLAAASGFIGLVAGFAVDRR